MIAKSTHCKICAYDSVSSIWKKVTNGVPQGLIFGILPFLIYFNDLLRITDNDANVVLFADDTIITAAHSNQGGFKQHQTKHSLI